VPRSVFGSTGTGLSEVSSVRFQFSSFVRYSGFSNLLVLLSKLL
jgi:hypothetical protein